jgi:hypothetical protein
MAATATSHQTAPAPFWIAIDLLAKFFFLKDAAFPITDFLWETGEGSREGKRSCKFLHSA